MQTATVVKVKGLVEDIVCPTESCKSFSFSMIYYVFIITVLCTNLLKLDRRLQSILFSC